MEIPDGQIGEDGSFETQIEFQMLAGSKVPGERLSNSQKDRPMKQRQQDKERSKSNDGATTPASTAEPFCMSIPFHE